MFGVENGCDDCACALSASAPTQTQASAVARPTTAHERMTPRLLIPAPFLVPPRRQRRRRDAPPVGFPSKRVRLRSKLRTRGARSVRVAAGWRPLWAAVSIGYTAASVGHTCAPARRHGVRRRTRTTAYVHARRILWRATIDARAARCASESLGASIFLRGDTHALHPSPGHTRP